MKQTAVEWLVNELNNRNWNTDFYKSDIISLIEQAKEMEKQQQGYSEEEVIEVLTQRCKEFGTKNEKFQKLLLKQDLEWFEQFKKK
jgi:hypothetical protein